MRAVVGGTLGPDLLDFVVDVDSGRDDCCYGLGTRDSSLRWKRTYIIYMNLEFLYYLAMKLADFVSSPPPSLFKGTYLVRILDVLTFKGQVCGLGACGVSHLRIL